MDWWVGTGMDYIIVLYYSIKALSLDLFEPPNLSKKRSRISNIPMLAQFPVSESKHINNIKFYFVSGRLVMKKIFTCMSAGYCVVDENHIIFRDQSVNGRARVGNGCEKTLVKLDEPFHPLSNIRVVLNVILVHILTHRTQIVILKNDLVKFLYNPLIAFNIHDSILECLSSETDDWADSQHERGHDDHPGGTDQSTRNQHIEHAVVTLGIGH